MNKRKYTKISHVLENMTYQCNCVTWGANLAFTDIENWQKRPHTVSFEATMMKKGRNMMMPSSSMWQINSKVTLTDSLRSTSKLPLYNKLTQEEAIHYLREFQKEPVRVSKFNEAYLGEKSEINDIPVPLDSRFITKSTRDAFYKNSLQIRQNERNYAPHIMMSEQIFMHLDKEKLEQTSYGDDIKAYDDEEKCYDPKSKMDWKVITKGLSGDLIEQLENNIDLVSNPVQIIALYRRQADLYTVRSPSKKPQNVYEGKGSYEISLIDADGLGISEIATTNSPTMAYRVVENFDNGMFRHYLDKVSAHAAVKDTYTFHYENARRYLNLLEQGTKIYSLS